jgi:heme exporter protein B
MRVACAVAIKDLRSEWRAGELIFSLAQFALLGLLIANFAFDITPTDTPQIAPGLLWLVAAFAGLVTVGRSFGNERDQASLESMLLTPASRLGILAGKAAVAVIMLSVCEVVVVAGLAFFFQVPVGSGSLIAALFLANLGMAMVGTLFSALAAQIRSRELLLPILAFPLWIPLVVAGGRAVQVAMGGGGTFSWTPLALLLDFDILFTVAAALTARFVLDD